MDGIARVYHCAAIVSFNSSDRDEMFKINVEGTANVVNACLNNNVDKLCYVSSVAALGRIYDGVEVSENMSWVDKSNNSNYSRSKHMAEVEVWRGVGEGLNAVIVNPSIILGAGDWSKGSSGIFKTAYNEFPWYTEGVTGFVDVVDVINAMIALMDSEVSGERFIINAENRKYKEVFTLIAQGFNKKPPHKKVNRLMAEIVWRLEAVKSSLTGTKPLLTKETAQAAQAVVNFDNAKIKKYLPSFQYTPLEVTIKRVCNELKKINNLND
jgi:nucleoside-diphosphate-sugar epimerase